MSHPGDLDFQDLTNKLIGMTRRFKVAALDTSDDPDIPDVVEEYLGMPNANNLGCFSATGWRDIDAHILDKSRSNEKAIQYQAKVHSPHINQNHF